MDSPKEVLENASNTSDGPCASILTGDGDRGLGRTQRFDCGMVHVNGPTMASEPWLPNGGVKESGRSRSSP